MVADVPALVLKRRLGRQLAVCALAVRIAQAWRRYLPSSARARRAAAATTVQAFWRGRACRREAALEVERLGLLRQLRAAAEGGSQAGVQVGFHISACDRQGRNTVGNLRGKLACLCQ